MVSYQNPGSAWSRITHAARTGIVAEIEATAPSTRAKTRNGLSKGSAVDWARNPSLATGQASWVIDGDDGRRRELFNSLIFHSNIEPDFTDRKASLARSIRQKKTSRRVIFGVLLACYALMGVSAIFLAATAPTGIGQIAAAVAAVISAALGASTAYVVWHEVRRRRIARSHATAVLKSMGYAVHISDEDFTKDHRDNKV